VPLFAGIDWGGGSKSRTVVVLASMRDDFVFQVRQIVALPVREDPNRVLEDVAKLCNQQQVTAIAADGNGHGHLYNGLLLDKVRPKHGFWAIYYSSATQDPVPDGRLWRWTVHRSHWIGGLFARVKQKKLVFPCRADSEPFLDEFACETAEYDD